MKPNKRFIVERVSHLRLAILLAILASVAAGSSASDPPQSFTPKIYYESNTLLWNNNKLGTAVAIPVCFTIRPREDAYGYVQCAAQTDRNKDCHGQAIATDALRVTIREHVENTWMRYGNVELHNWGDCPVDAATNMHNDKALAGWIQIQFSHVAIPSPNQACTDDTGCSATANAVCDCSSAPNNTCDSNNQGVCIEGPVDWTAFEGMKADRANVIQYTAPAVAGGTNIFNQVHEFGHALGFHHEWLRPNWTGTRCGQDAYVAAGNTLTTPPDAESIMEYCDDIGQPVLSAWDIIGLQKAYGRKYDGSLVGFRGQCADISGANSANGTSVIAFSCRGQWNDTFFWGPYNTLRATNNNTGNRKCLNVRGGTAPNAVISWTCGDYPNEVFRFQDVEWRGMGNMCVEAVKNKLQLHICNGSPDQRWEFFHNSSTQRRDQIRQHGTNKCVASTSNAGALGQELVLTTCSLADVKQRFTFPGRGRVALFSNRELCANVAGGEPNAGSRIILWDGCGLTPVVNAQFTLNGRIRSLGHCMTIQGSANPGDAIRMEACNPSNTTTQIWEYYF